MKLKRLTLCGLLTAVALGIFVAETQLPALLPVPGIKPGLSNLVTLFALVYLSPRETILILLARILLGGLFSGTPSVLLYSLSGGLCCLLAELFLVSRAPIWAVSILGAMTHNLVQLLVAALVTQTVTVFFYLPILLISGILTGLFTGICIYILHKYCGKTLKRLLQ